jgi:hypothetical protein
MRDDRKKRSRFKALLDSIRRLLGKHPKHPPQSPGDPYSDRMAPVRRGPKGRSGAAAVAEPEEDSYRAFPPRASK